MAAKTKNQSEFQKAWERAKLHFWNNPTSARPFKCVDPDNGLQTIFLQKATSDLDFDTHWNRIKDE